MEEKKIHGKEVFVSCAGRVLAAAKDCTLTIRTELIEIADFESGAWRNYMPGVISWNFTTTHLLTTNGIKNAETLRGVACGVSIHIGEGMKYEGVAIMDEFKVSGTKGNLASGQFGWTGCGKLHPEEIKT